MSVETALALARPSAFAVQPAPRRRMRHLQNARRLRQLTTGAAPSSTWWNATAAADELARQLDAEGFVILDGFCEEACAPLRPGAAQLLANAAGGRLSAADTASAADEASASDAPPRATDAPPRASRGTSALRGDLTVWAGEVELLYPLLHRLDALSLLLGSRIADASDLSHRSSAQLSRPLSHPIFPMYMPRPVCAIRHPIPCVNFQVSWQWRTIRTTRGQQLPWWRRWPLQWPPAERRFLSESSLGELGGRRATHPPRGAGGGG